MPRQSLDVTFTLTIEGGGMRLTSSPPPTTGKVGVPWTHTFTVDGGVAPYTWSAISLPPWMAMTQAFGGGSCIVSGTPTVAGTFAPALRVADSGTILNG